MTWLALRALFGGMFSKLWTWLSGRSFWQLVCIGLALFAAVQHFEIVRARHEAAKWQKQYTAEHSGRISDRAAYVAAQAKAASDNKAKVERTENQSKGISTDERQSYLSDLAKLRTDNQRLRAQAASAASGAAGPTASPPAPAPAAGADGDGLHLSPDEHLQAQEIELRLMHLQDWVEKQLAIDPNK